MMKKQTANKFTISYKSEKLYTKSSRQGQGNNNKKHIYTEEDLGEGILDVGVSLLYVVENNRWTPEGSIEN